MSVKSSMSSVKCNLWKVLEPCKDCPVEYGDKAMHLKEGRVAEIKQALEDGEGFSCHKTIYDDGDPKFCAGAYNHLKRIGKPNQIMQIAKRMGLDG